jgi:hypothetical protein
MLRCCHAFVLFVLLLSALGLGAPTLSEAAVVVTIVKPTNDVAPVLEQQTMFQAQLIRNGVEDHTAGSTFVWEFSGGAPGGQITGNPVYAGFFQPGLGRSSP